LDGKLIVLTGKCIHCLYKDYDQLSQFFDDINSYDYGLKGWLTDKYTPGRFVFYKVDK